MTSTPGFDLNLTRTIGAPPERIYDIWLDPKSPGGPWFGAERAIVNATVDGLFYHNVEHEGKNWAHYGRFITLERGSRIVHTWMSEATHGRETILTLALTPVENGTYVVLTHSGIPDDDLGRSHRDGWTWMLDMLEKKFKPD